MDKLEGVSLLLVAGEHKGVLLPAEETVGEGGYLWLGSGDPTHVPF